MSSGLREISADDIQVALERVLTPALSGRLAKRQPGHCARVIDAEAPLAVRLCERIRTAVSNDAQVFVLGAPPLVPAEVAVTSTKLVELRNPDEAGRQRPPLLVFVPPGTHASAEDSFGVATFEDIPLGDVYADLAGRLLAELPVDLRREVAGILDTIEEEKWPHATSYSRARFLLTIQVNDNDPEVVGAAFFELGLVPDLELFADPAQIRTRTGLNIRQMAVLTQPDRPERQRVLELGLTDATFRAKLAAFVAETGLDDPREWTRRIVVDRTNWPLSFHRWPLRESKETEAVRITVGELGLPRVGDRPEHADNPLLRNLAGQPFLVAGQQGPNQLPVSFEVHPDPRRIPGLARFSAQIVSEDSGPTGVAASVKLSTTGKSRYSVTYRKLRGSRPGAGLALHPAPAPGRARESACRSSPRHQARIRTTKANASSSSRTAVTTTLRTCSLRSGPRSILASARRSARWSSARSGRDATGGPSSAVRLAGRIRWRRRSTCCARLSARMESPRSRSPPRSRTSSGRCWTIQRGSLGGRCGLTLGRQPGPFGMK